MPDPTPPAAPRPCECVSSLGVACTLHAGHPGDCVFRFAFSVSPEAARCTQVASGRCNGECVTCAERDAEAAPPRATTPEPMTELRARVFASSYDSDEPTIFGKMGMAQKYAKLLESHLSTLERGAARMREERDAWYGVVGAIEAVLYDGDSPSVADLEAAAHASPSNMARCYTSQRERQP